MTTFKTFFKIMLKRLNSILIYLFIFMGIGIAFAASSDSTGNAEGFNSSKPHAAIFDYDKTDESRKLYDYLGERCDTVKIEDDKNLLLDALQSGVIETAVYIPKGFSQKLADNELEDIIEIKAFGESYAKTLVASQTEEYLRLGLIYNETENDICSALDMAKDNLKENNNTTIHSSSQTTDYTMYYFKYFCYVVLMIIINGMVSCLLPFNNKEIKQRVGVSAERFGRFNIQLLTASVVFVTAVIAIMLSVGIAMGTHSVSGKVMLYYIINVLCVVLVSMAIAYLISKFAENQGHLSIASNVIGLAMSFLCGVFVPIEFLGNKVIAAARFLPFYWYESAVSKISDGTFNFLYDGVSCFGIQLLMAAAITVTALAASKKCP